MRYLCIAFWIAVVAASVLLVLTGCTKNIPIKVTETVVERIEVPTLVLQRCIAPTLSDPPDVQPYKCEKDHLCLDPENRGKLEYFVGLMLMHIDWLEKHCTEQTKEEILAPQEQEEDIL